MNIIEYSEKYAEDVKDLLVELQTYLASLDKRGVLVLKENYRDGYFSYVTEEVKNHNGKIFLAQLNDAIVGLVVCKIFQGGGESEYTTSSPKVGFISDLIVREDLRGKRIGHWLLREANDFFKANECEYTQLEVFSPNAEAFVLYKKLGFEVNCLYMSQRTDKLHICRSIPKRRCGGIIKKKHSDRNKRIQRALKKYDKEEKALLKAKKNHG